MHSHGTHTQLAAMQIARVSAKVQRARAEAEMEHAAARRRGAEMKRAELGAVVYALLKAATEMSDDAISAHYGVYPDPAPTFERIALEHGWELPAIREELEARGVSEKWQYFSGLGEVLPDAGQMAKAIEQQRDGYVCDGTAGVPVVRGSDSLSDPRD
jgi:hypothetical protein